MRRTTPARLSDLPPHPCGIRIWAVAGCTALLAGACAGAADSPGGKAPTGIGTLANGTYVLSAEEQALDCRKLTGRMQVRLLSVRGAEYKSAPTGISSAARSVSSTLLFTDTASNASERANRDRPMLDAYNRRLKEQGCASFDLDKELAARPSAPPPIPSVPAAGKSG